MPAFSIIMPAYRAETTISRAVRSVLSQSEPDWELIIISDDGADYATQLAKEDLNDPRIRFGTTGKTGSGSSNARNAGHAKATGRFVGPLDADDAFHPQKLERVREALSHGPLVSTGLQIVDGGGGYPRTVGVTGEDALLPAHRYKRTNLSMDSMLVWDREAVDIAYDPDLPCLVDLDLVMKAFEFTEAAFHLGAPLHLYYKQAVSISNGPGASNKFSLTKQRLIDRINTGHYRFADRLASQSFVNFLTLSLSAEQDYPRASGSKPGLLFEDHLEARLSADSVA
nr:glycosyltransferase family 2 protein [Cucumibacter marinus]